MYTVVVPVELLAELLLVPEDIVELVPELEDVPELDVVVNLPGGIIEVDELVLKLELDILVVDNELELTDIERVLLEVILLVAELELDELEESLGGPAEYTTAPAG
jgi:hypothetical protein